MEALNRIVVFTSVSWRNDPNISNRKKPERCLAYRNGCSLLAIPLHTLSMSMLNRRSDKRKKYSVIAAFERVNGAPRRRNSLRPKLIKQIKVREPSSMPESNSNLIGHENSVEENLIEGLENKLSESLENKSSESLEEGCSGSLGENVYIKVEKEEIRDTGQGIWDKLENLSLQLKKDTAAWGVGADPVFTFYENCSGGIERVSIDENAILERCGISPTLAEFADEDAMSIANTRIARARLLAKEIENGISRPPRNSNVFRFVKPGKTQLQMWGEGFGSVMGQVGGVARRVPAFVKFSVVGFTVLYGCCFFWAARKYLFSDVPLTRKEFEEEKKKKMMMRKMKLRMEKDRMDKEFVGKEKRVSDSKLLKGIVYKHEAELQKESISMELYKRNLDMNEAELQKKVMATTTSKGKLPMDDTEFDKKILKIRSMAREARKTEHQNALNVSNFGITAGDSVDEAKDLNAAASVVDPDLNGKLGSGPIDISALAGVLVVNDKADKIAADIIITQGEKLDLQNRIVSGGLDLKNSSHPNKVASMSEVDSNAIDDKEFDATASLADSSSTCDRKELKPMDIPTLTGARTDSNDKQDKRTARATTIEKHLDFSNGIEGNNSVSDIKCSCSVRNTNTSGHLQLTVLQDGHNSYTGADESAGTERTAVVQGPKTLEDRPLNKPESVLSFSRKRSRRTRPRVITSVEEARAILASKLGEPSINASVAVEKYAAMNASKQRIEGGNHDRKMEIGDPFRPPNDDSFSVEPSTANKSMAAKQTELSVTVRPIDENYEKLRPAFRKVNTKKMVPDESKSIWQYNGTRLAKFAENESDVESHGTDSDESESKTLQIEPQNGIDKKENSLSAVEAEEFDWTKDDVLREIVLKVQANEEAGKEPFDSLGSEEEDLFFKGINDTIEREGERVNKWISERVENLDYGKDGIGYDDQPRVYMAQWNKDQPKRSRLVDKLKEDRQKFMEEKIELYPPAVPEKESSSGFANSTSNLTSFALPSINSTHDVTDTRCESHNGSSTSAKTVISSSGKSNKFVKQLKHESWKHTKKWSRAVQEKYDAERDPEIKAIMRNVGQDLDRWITEEKVKEVSEIVSRSSDEQLKYIKARMQKESEMFGRRAMLSKYREYKSKTEDYLWWLDLPYVLCIGLYRNKNGEIMKGLYSLEMAPDLDSKSQRFHVVAFEDKGDAKNFCYILRNKLENAIAHVIPCAPKELYREAKSEDYKVTVVKKAQIELHIDQPLEEMEGIITEIGSAMYYDKILDERVIDMDSVLNDALGFGARRPK